jgi:hypothetical protein
MSTSEIKAAIGELPTTEQAELAAWLLQQCEPSAPAESGAVIEELNRRKQEYLDHPERFVRFENESEMKEWFEDIRREVDSRVSSARQA